MPEAARGARIPRTMTTTTHGNGHGQGRQEDTQGQDLRGQPWQHASAFAEVEGGGEGCQAGCASGGEEGRGQEGRSEEDCRLILSPAHEKKPRNAGLFRGLPDRVTT